MSTEQAVEVIAMRVLQILKSTTLVLALATAVGSRADDTDIYLDVNASAAGEPFLMLILDWRPDVMSSNSCKFTSSLDTSSAKKGQDKNCDEEFLWGPISYMIRRANTLGLTGYSDGDSVSPVDAFRAVFAAFMLGYKVVKRNQDGSPIAIGGVQCSDADTRDECFYSYAGVGKPDDPAKNDANGINIGLMLSHANKNLPTGKGDWSQCISNPPNKEGCSNGAYVLKAFSTIEDTDKGTDPSLPLYQTLKRLYAVPQPNADKGSPGQHFYQGKEVYAELHRYLTGGAVLNGHRGYQDFDTSGTTGGDDCSKTPNGRGNGVTNLDASCEGASTQKPYSWDVAAERNSGANYTAPLTTGNQCSKLFAINTVSGEVNQEDDSDDAIREDMKFTSDPTFPQVIAHMYNSKQYGSEFGLTSYFLSQKVNTTTNEWAAAGGTASAIKYSSDLNQVLLSLQDIARQILSVSTTFVAASVPVSAFNRVLTDENYYIALFRSDPKANLFWPGNLKRLKVQVDTLDDGTKQLRIVARNPSGTGVIDAFDPLDGRLNWNALTYWTDQAKLPAITDGMYQSVPENVANMVAGADGRVVERGGAGQKIPGAISGNSPGLTNGATGARTLYTEALSGTTAGTNGMIALEATSTLGSNSQLQSLLGLDAAQTASWRQARAEKLLRYMRGLETTASGSNPPARKWIMGSAIHSRPVPINYGLRNDGDTSPDIRLFLGTNDGWFHQFKNATGSGTDLGNEVFAFMPHYAMGIQKYLAGSDPFATPDADFTPHPYEKVLYGSDGPVSAYLEYGSDNKISTGATEDKAYVYFGMRRGGYGYYAFDVKNPDSPRLVWAAKKTDSNFGELGMTFSQPVLAHVKYADAASTDIRVLIFGGGYNGGWSGADRVGDDAVNAADTQGNAIFIVNAETGELIWKAVKGTSSGAVSNTRYEHAGLDHSIPSDLGVIDINGDGYHDAAFVGDTGGNVWRVDFPSWFGDSGGGSNRQTNWKLTKVANLTTASGTASADQRFFSAPEVVRSRDSEGDFISIALGSGNREDPLDLLSATRPQNWFYVVKDRNVFATPTTESPTTHTSLADITSGSCSTTACTSALTNGWRLQLASTGEKAITDPVVRLGTLFFTTYVPPDPNAANSCAPKEGGSYVYAVSLAEGAAMKDYNMNGTINTLDRRRAVGAGIVPPPPPLIPRELIGDIFQFPGRPPDDVIKIPPLPVYWYESNVDK